MTSLVSIQDYDAVTAFSMSAPDSDTYFFQDAPESLFCPECGSYLAAAYLPSDLTVRPGFRDFGFTYDGRLLVSDRARQFLLRHASTGLSFRGVNQADQLFVVEAAATTKFDPNARRTRFVNKCEECGHYESVVGATPAFLELPDSIEDYGIYRTDIEFGSGKEKSPLFVVGPALKRLLEREFGELDFQAVRTA